MISLFAVGADMRAIEFVDRGSPGPRSACVTPTLVRPVAEQADILFGFKVVGNAAFVHPDTIH